MNRWQADRVWHQEVGAQVDEQQVLDVQRGHRVDQREKVHDLREGEGGWASWWAVSGQLATSWMTKAGSCWVARAGD